MTTPTILVSTWSNGLLAFEDQSKHEERPGEPIRALTRADGGGTLAIVGGTSLCRRSTTGEWSTLARSEIELACSVAVGDAIYVGTENAQVMRIRSDDSWERLGGFDHVPGRDQWYAGSALVNGRRVGPPLGIRSLTVTCDHAALLANVHVGGIPRSIDGGATWQPTIDIETDVQQVCAHPTRPEIVAAASGAGLCISRDGGATWTVGHEGLHAPYCSAVAFVGDTILVSASTDHFAGEGAIYRRPIDSHGPLHRVSGGLPPWLEGVVDTDNIATSGDFVAVASREGSLYVSTDTGFTWTLRADGIPGPSSLFICESGSLSASPFLVTFIGWAKLKDKIALTKTIRQYTHLGLGEAQTCCDRILGHQMVEFEILEQHVAEAFLEDMRALGIEGKLSAATIRAPAGSLSATSHSEGDAPHLLVLERATNRGYLSKPIPTERDDEIAGVLERCVDDGTVARFSQALTPSHADVLLVFAERMASTAVRNRRPETLRIGLFALLLGYRAIDDERDALLIFPLFLDAAEIIGMTSAQLLEPLRAVAGDFLLTPMVEFLSRSDEDKSLRSMGYARSSDEGGFRYRRNW